MRKFFFSVAIFFTGTQLVLANDPTLMIINGKPVKKSEFEYIYNKNNSNNSLDKKTLTEYVDLFVNFKLKVEEAKAQGLDTTKAFVTELAGYRSQLTTPYLTDSKVDDGVLQEAYNRMKEDVEVSHILIRTTPNASPADTLAAFKKIMAIAKRIEKEDFAKVAKELSEDESAKDNSGYIGWISAFRTVYPFETMAYNTKVGTISKPVRSSFGYHLIKVINRRQSPGEIFVSHIMQFTEKDNDIKNKAAKQRIDSIYSRIQAGDDFAKLATAHSDDKGSFVKNGELPWFGTGRMIPEFESAAFALKNIGDISTPIQSSYGWHIIKMLDKRGIASFDNLKEDIQSKVKRDERAQLGQKSFIAKLKSEYNYKVNAEAIADYYKLLENKSLTDSTFQLATAQLSKPIISFATKTLTQADFNQFLKANTYTDKSTPATIINEKAVTFGEKELLAYEDKQLENKYEDFRFLMQEYHDGILLFEVSNNQVWDKASKDTAGLATYFKQNTADYKWEKPHYKGRLILCKDKNTFKLAKKLVKKIATDSIDKYLTTRLN
nr:peptidylprolyl isomerase [Paludibacter sp.]